MVYTVYIHLYTNMTLLYEVIVEHLSRGQLLHIYTGLWQIVLTYECLLQTEIKKAGDPTKHLPEVILNNFNTRLGQTVGRMFASLFPHDPQFKGRRVITFHNQRDFIFFRHHRYQVGGLSSLYQPISDISLYSV